VSTTFPPEVEPFVSAEKAAAFLDVAPRFLLNLARKGHIPAYPLGSGPRKVWRFRLSEIARVLAELRGDNSTRQSSALKPKEK
jgi:hypothetical protein